MKLRFRTIFWAAAGIVLVLAIGWSFMPRPVPADFAQVQRGTLVVTVQDEGYTRVREVYTVSAPVGGRLLRVEAEPGDPVAIGETLANILPSDPAFLDARSQGEAEAAQQAAEALLGFANAEVAQAEAQVEYARTEMRRVSTLAERGTVSQGAVDRARLELRSAEAALSTARANVRARTAERDAAAARLMEPGDDGFARGVVNLTSPIDGRVLRRLQESETVLQPGEPVLELGDPRDLEIVAELLSTDAVRIVEGANATIEAWGGEGVLNARVRRIEPTGFLKISALGVEEQRVNVILDLTDPPESWASLGHGFRVEPRIEVWRGEDEIIAPIAALFRTTEGWACFVTQGGRAELRRVELGRSNGIDAQILSGLDAGETLVLYPSDRISDGAQVRARG
ncbi:HlyD family efflux transporter periplasmic adaptor subunit [Maricaulaceae bacterium NA33B04]|nr:HlyD family efflux transporter periplasmic adaptor subunit [Maricaulaceae bacterium NA33B04]